MLMSQVRYFLAVAEQLNFTRAAKSCGVSQPSLSNAIRSLESEFGGALFERKPTVSLTPLGKAVLQNLTEMVRQSELAREAARNLPQGPSPQLFIRADMRSWRRVDEQT